MVANGEGPTSRLPKELEGRVWKPVPKAGDSAGLNPELRLPPEWLREERVLRYDVLEYDWDAVVREVRGSTAPELARFLRCGADPF